MVAVKAGDVEATLRRPPTRPVLLFYGPDSGLVGERARKAARDAVSDPDDPFQLVRLDGDALAGDPARLADEAGTIGLFGGRRAIWVSPTGRNLVPAVTLVLDNPPRDALIVIEAGDLGKSSPLRVLCEKSPEALALPCYPDGARDIGSLIDETLRSAALTIDRDVREMLIGQLGADRAASRAELEKLTLFAHAEGKITEKHVTEIVGDVSALAIDGVIDGAFGGRFAALDRAWTRLAAEGLDAGMVLGAALRHGLSLARWRQAVDGGQPPGRVIEQNRSIHFSRRDAIARQLGGWSETQLMQAITTLGQAVLDVRRQPGLARETTRQALWVVATQARRNGLR